jgi:23S rRNA (adenine2503-C2)-methyltransferase
MSKISIYDYSLDDFNNYFINMGEKPYRSTQILEWIYRHKIKDFNEMKNIRKDIIQKLDDEFYFSDIKLVKKSESSDKTIKFLFELEDGNLIESVLMNQVYGKSLCVTSQIGCNMGCSFCASGLNKKIRNLKTSEMILQILKVEEIINDKISHVVVMGIGEPFDNYDNLLKFLRIINFNKGLMIGSRHITVSTSGLVEKIKAFAEFDLQVNLAISLHASSNQVRDKIMKVNKVYNLEKLINAIDYYIEKTNRRVTIEYILIDNVNDRKEDAYLLADIFKNKLVYVNLIPYNEVTDFDYKRSSEKNTKIFFDILKKANINVTLRKEFGKDIDAACGQLRNKTLKQQNK